MAQLPRHQIAHELAGLAHVGERVLLAAARSVSAVRPVEDHGRIGRYRVEEGKRREIDDARLVDGADPPDRPRHDERFERIELEAQRFEPLAGEIVGFDEHDEDECGSIAQARMSPTWSWRSSAYTKSSSSGPSASRAETMPMGLPFSTTGTCRKP